MHKEVAVAEVELDEATGLITAVYDVSNAAHLPLGVSVRKGIADRAALNEWWMGRAIPANRAGLRHVLEELNIHTAKTSGKVPEPQPVRPILDLSKG